jgi:hypothetical protein
MGGLLDYTGLDPSDNSNMARLIELQRLLAPVMTARWVVMHAAGNEPIIENDLGYVLFQAPDHAGVGYAIPLTMEAVLGILPTTRRTIVILGAHGDWRAPIEHRHLRANDHSSLNDRLADFCQQSIFGPTRESVERQASRMGGAGEVPPDPGLVGLAPRHRICVAHEFEWHRLVTVLAMAPGDSRVSTFPIDWSVVASDWCSPPIFPLNLPTFPSGLRWNGRAINLALNEVPGFTDESPGV